MSQTIDKEEETIVWNAMQLHDTAMKFCDVAAVFRSRQNKEAENYANSCAFYWSSLAVKKAIEDSVGELTIGVLCRSAAWCGVDAGEFQKAIELADVGLNFCSIGEIREELQEAKEAAIAGKKS